MGLSRNRMIVSLNSPGKCKTKEKDRLTNCLLRKYVFLKGNPSGKFNSNYRPDTPAI